MDKAMAAFDLSVNGRAVRVTVANEETSLLAVLRDTLGLVGTRFGCGLEQCGCCMVLIDGAPQKSCAKPIWSVAGKSDSCSRRFSRTISWMMRRR